ncbi:MAG: PqqD family protein [Syntrophothermus sp.]
MKINKDIAISEAGMVFNPLTGESFSANPIAAEIIDMIQKGDKPEKIVGKLTSRYNVEEHACEKDLQDFIDILRHYHILQDEEKKA